MHYIRLAKLLLIACGSSTLHLLEVVITVVVPPEHLQSSYNMCWYGDIVLQSGTTWLPLPSYEDGGGLSRFFSIASAANDADNLALFNSHASLKFPLVLPPQEGDKTE